MYYKYGCRSRKSTCRGVPVLYVYLEYQYKTNINTDIKSNQNKNSKLKRHFMKRLGKISPD